MEVECPLDEVLRPVRDVIQEEDGDKVSARDQLPINGEPTMEPSSSNARPWPPKTPWFLLLSELVSSSVTQTFP